MMQPSSDRPHTNFRLPQFRDVDASGDATPYVDFLDHHQLVARFGGLLL